MAAESKTFKVQGVDYNYTVEKNRKTKDGKALPAVIRFDYTAHKGGVDIEVVEAVKRNEGIQGLILSAVVQATKNGELVSPNGKVFIRSIDAYEVNMISSGKEVLTLDKINSEIVKLQDQERILKVDLQTYTNLGEDGKELLAETRLSLVEVVKLMRNLNLKKAALISDDKVKTEETESDAPF